MKSIPGVSFCRMADDRPVFAPAASDSQTKVLLTFDYCGGAPATGILAGIAERERRVMRKLILTALFSGLAAHLCAGADPEGTPKSVTGWVLDSACAFTKGLKKPISRDCALACAKTGSPLVSCKMTERCIGQSRIHACRGSEQTAHSLRRENE